MALAAAALTQARPGCGSACYGCLLFQMIFSVPCKVSHPACCYNTVMSYRAITLSKEHALPCCWRAVNSGAESEHPQAIPRTCRSTSSARCVPGTGMRAHALFLVRHGSMAELQLGQLYSCPIKPFKDKASRASKAGSNQGQSRCATDVLSTCSNSASWGFSQRWPVHQTPGWSTDQPEWRPTVG